MIHSPSLKEINFPTCMLQGLKDDLKPGRMENANV